MNTRRKTPTAIYEKLSPNCNTPRSKKIKRITPHHVAGNLTIEGILTLNKMTTYNPTKGCSVNYAIGTDGRIGLGVEEGNRAWTSSSATNDNQAITFEISNDSGAPNWTVSDAAAKTWITTCADICKYYGYKRLRYVPKPNNIGISTIENWLKSWEREDEMIVTLHKWFAATGCPGPYIEDCLPAWVDEVNKLLGVIDKSEFSTSSLEEEQFDKKEFKVKVLNTAMNVRERPGLNSKVITVITDCGVYTIVEVVNYFGTKWGKLKSGVGWISLNDKYVIRL